MNSPPADPDPSRCHLLGPTALVVQGLMGAFVLGSLVVKRQLEKRKRRWKVWMWDVSKQLVGQAVIHSLNLLISYLVANAEDNNPCSLYFLNVLIDTTIGVAIFYYSLKWLTSALSTRLEGLQSGYYGEPPQVKYWWRQLIPYLISIIIMKLLVLLPLTLPGISTVLLRFGYGLLEYLSPSVQVIFVMMVFPLIMNTLQFCLIDQVIKAGQNKADEYEPIDEEVPALPKSPSALSSARSSLERERRSSAPSPRPTSSMAREARRSLSPEAPATISQESVGLKII